MQYFIILRLSIVSHFENIYYLVLKSSVKVVYFFWSSHGGSTAYNFEKWVMLEKRVTVMPQQ